MKNESIEVRTAFDDQLISTLNISNSAEVERVLENAVTLLASANRSLPRQCRLIILIKILQLITENANQIAHIIASEGGQNINESIHEVNTSLISLQNIINTMQISDGEHSVPNPGIEDRQFALFMRSTSPGVSVTIYDSIFPFKNFVSLFAQAFGYGNPLIAIPSYHAPLSCVYFVELLREAGLPDCWCQLLIVQDFKQIKSIANDMRVSFVFYFGISEAGWDLCRSHAANNRKYFVFNATTPIIVDSDVGIERVVAKLLTLALHHSGQVRNSLQRVFCHNLILESFVGELGKLIDKLTVGDPLKDETQIGPLINRKEVNRINEWVIEARKTGSVATSGGVQLSESCYSPTVLLNVLPKLKISKNDIQGPVICVNSYHEFDSINSYLHFFPNVFQLRLFCDDMDKLKIFHRNLDIFPVTVNDLGELNSHVAPTVKVGII